MTKDELIEQLKSDLSVMLEWVGAISDEYLDSDEDTRKEFCADCKAARATMMIEPDAV